MRKENPMYSIFPIRGAYVDDWLGRESYLMRPWSLVGRSRQSEFNDLVAHPAGFGDHFSRLVSRLAPNCLLVVRDADFSDADLSSFRGFGRLRRRAEAVTAALNIVMLLSSRLIEKCGRIGGKTALQPFPIWIPHYSESLQLPTIFDQSRLRSVGHTQDISWFDVEQATNIPRSSVEFDEIVSSAPAFAQRLLAEPLRDSRIARTLISLSRSFNATTIGQFISSCATVLEILFGLNGTKDDDVASKVKLFVPEGACLITQMIRARNDFVHRNREPSFENREMHIRALALTVSVIHRYEALYDVLARQSDEPTLALDAYLRMAHYGGRLVNLLSLAADNDLRNRISGIGQEISKAAIPEWAVTWLT